VSDESDTASMSNVYCILSELWLKAHFKTPVHTGRYQVELWHQETGSRIKYKGPYDVCCGLKVNSSCGHGVFLKDPVDLDEHHHQQQQKQEEASQTTPTDCPIEGEFIGHFVKSLHQEVGYRFVGLWTAMPD